MEEDTTFGAHDLAHHPSITHKSCSSRKQRKCPKLQKKKAPKAQCVVKEDDNEEEEEDGGDDEKVGIEKRIMALQRLVPGGESLEVDKLFEETAGYILALQDQVKTMKVLTSIFEGLEKENRKLGG